MWFWALRDLITALCEQSRHSMAQLSRVDTGPALKLDTEWTCLPFARIEAVGRQSASQTAFGARRLCA